ncbi:hypothetical protein ANANG_G00029950 [Anguilla anguilla]|uniref:SMP-LTD domain-containing protein n=1 Tax=Anguilla anguilla TaxID=7936 RepID=A0A9D3MRL7_ANGAN|nr:hypothetical protein ANANG_G00029950 [Anguilla anguilla]
MTSQSGGHAERPGAPPSRPPAAPKLQVQRSLSRETITIHFSALGKEEEEEEEELYGAAISAISASSAAGRDYDDQGIVTALEASEDLLFEGAGGPRRGAAHLADVAVLPVSSTTLPSIPQRSGHSAPSPALSILSSLHSAGGSAPASSSWPSGQKAQAQAPPPAASSSGSSPSKSVALPSGDKPFMSLVKSLSTDVEPREGVAVPPSVRHRHLMKTLLFKQFTQPRVTGAGDSKTAPSSPLTSPDNRSFFKVSEVEARIEDTKRRLSEVIYEPLQLLSKIMGEESGAAAAAAAGGPRAKALSSSASELCSLAALNGHLESNNNSYSIKEEECDSDGRACRAAPPPPPPPPKSPPASRPPPAPPLAEAWSPRHASLALEKCSMSALARQGGRGVLRALQRGLRRGLCRDGRWRRRRGGAGRGGRASLPPSGSTGVGSEDETEAEEEEDEEPGSSVPHKTLCALTMLVYGYLVLPLPTYLGGVLLGVAVGFMLAIGVVWLAAPRCSGYASRRGRRRDRLWNVAHLDIKEPGMFKGWMNEILNYDPETYHATLTHSVFVRLDGSTLRLSKPGRNVARRATFNEPKPDVTYVSQKIYDLTDSKIYLVPESLARKRVWNKKYPICIELGKQEDFMSKAQADKPEAVEEKAAGAGERLEAAGGRGGQEAGRRGAGRGPGPGSPGPHPLPVRQDGAGEGGVVPPDAGGVPAEVGDQKGLQPAWEYERRPAHAQPQQQGQSGRGAAHDAAGGRRSWPRGVKQKMLLDYSVYMAKYLPGSPGVEEESVAWVNALVGRIFWDFLGEKYWADMVSKKIQMKLSKIRLPYFMNELTLTELDMGVAIPKILQASKPSVDHQGLWFDLEISYNGSFLMTLETKMNLARLGKVWGGQRAYRPRTYCLADSDEESSSAGSSDEEDPPDVAPDKNILPGAEG